MLLGFFLFLLGGARCKISIKARVILIHNFLLDLLPLHAWILLEQVWILTWLLRFLERFGCSLVFLLLVVHVQRGFALITLPVLLLWVDYWSDTIALSLSFKNQRFWDLSNPEFWQIGFKRQIKRDCNTSGHFILFQSSSFVSSWDSTRSVEMFLLSSNGVFLNHARTWAASLLFALSIESSTLKQKSSDPSHFLGTDTTSRI